MPSVITPCGGAGGIKYNVANQTGGFLDIFTNTGSIDIEDRSGTGLTLHSEDPGGTTGGFVEISTADGQVFIHSTIVIVRTGNRFEIQDEGLVRRFEVDKFGDMTVRLATGSVVDILNNAGNSVFTVFESGRIEAKGLPIVNPGGTGRLWNNGGVVNIT